MDFDGFMKWARLQNDWDKNFTISEEELISQAVTFTVTPLFLENFHT